MNDNTYWTIAEKVSAVLQMLHLWVNLISVGLVVIFGVVTLFLGLTFAGVRGTLSTCSWITNCGDIFLTPLVLGTDLS